MPAPISTRRSSANSFKAVHDAWLQACGEEGIVAEYAALGVVFSEDKTRRNGCRSCYALIRRDGTDDNNPSAYVNVTTGKYKDSKDGREIDIWQLAADAGRYATWEIARDDYLARQGLSFKPKGGKRSTKSKAATTTASTANTPSPRKPAKRSERNDSWLEHVHPERDSAAAHNFMGQFTISKGGFKRDAFIAAGGFYSRYPYGRTRDDGTPMDAFLSVVGVPVHGPAIIDPTTTSIGDTTAAGAVIWQKSALPFEEKAKDKEGNDTVDHVKMRTVVTGDGLIGNYGLQLIVDDRARVARGELSQIDRIWKVEGPTDLFALYSIIPATLRDRNPIISCAGGSTSVSPWTSALIRGYHVVVIHDLDSAGEQGVDKTCQLWGPAAASITPLRLAGKVELKKGADLRDRIIAGLTFDELEGDLLLADAYTVTDADREAAARYEAEGYGADGQRSDGQNSANPDADPDIAPLEADDDPHRLARVFLEQNCWSIEFASTTLRFWRQEWHLWNGRAYVRLDPTDLTGLVNKAIKDEFDRLNIVAQERDGDDLEAKPAYVRKVSRGLVLDVIAAIQGQCSLPSDQEAPFWISGKGPWPASEGFATGSGIIHLASLVDGKPDNLYPTTPDFFSPNAVHYGFPNNDPNQCPTPVHWHEFLNSLWADDYQQIQLLQEWMGYCLLPDTAQQKLLLFIGPKRSGKGTIARTLTQLVGENNVVNPRLSQFDKEYGMWPLVGKTVAIIGDARLSGRTDTAEIVETLLSISGEDKQTVNRKHMSYVHTRLRTRFTILSNAMPDLQDTSGAFHSRCLLLETKQSFEGRENKNLEQELLAELPGILVWAIQGWARLRERGHFEQPESSKNALKQFEYLTSPMKKFIDEFCIVGSDEWVNVDTAYGAYCDFCKSNRIIIKPKPVFARDLKSVINHMHTTQRRDKSGERFRVFEGFRMKSESELYFDDENEE